MPLPVPNLRKEVAAALGTLGQPESESVLLPYKDDTDPDVRKNVRWALERILKGAA